MKRIGFPRHTPLLPIAHTLLTSSYPFESVKPLWHLMAFTSVVMYTTNYICLKGKLMILTSNIKSSDISLIISLSLSGLGGKVKHAREEQKTALDEYYKNHGIASHH